MDWSPIAKPRGALRREPCLTDYEQARRDFAWAQANHWLSGLPGGALNMAFEADGFDSVFNLNGGVIDWAALGQSLVIK